MTSYVDGFSKDPMRPISLAFFRLLVSFGFVFSCAAIFSRASGSRFIGSLLTAVASAAVLISGSFSSSTFGWLFFAIYLAQLLRLRESGARNELIKLLALGVLYVNCHPSAYAAFLVGALLVLPRIDAKARTLYFSALFAPIVLTPYFGSQAVISLSTFVAEFSLALSLQSNPSNVFQYQFSFLLLAWLVVAIGYFHARALRFKEELILGICFTTFALAQAAYLPYATILVLLLVALMWKDSDGASFGNFGLSVRLLRGRLAKWELPGIIFVLFCITVVSVVQLYKFPRRGALPTQALALMEERAVSGPLLHDLSASGYVLKHFRDAKGLSRVSPAYDQRVAFFDWEIAAEIALFELRGLGFSKIIDRIQPNAAIALSDTLLYQQLAMQPEWRLAYEWGAIIGEEKLPPVEQRRGKSWALFLKH